MATLGTGREERRKRSVKYAGMTIHTTMRHDLELSSQAALQILRSLAWDYRTTTLRDAMEAAASITAPRLSLEG